MLARWKVIDENFGRRVAAGNCPKIQHGYPRDQLPCSDSVLLDLFDSQCKSRHLDLIARVLKEQQQSYYTIGSSGHEANAAVGCIARQTDMAFLHYRSAALFIQRAKKVPAIDPVRDILLSLVTAKDDPACSGRHKVFGSLPLLVPPQTSTIASHLPKAVGAAFSIHRAKRLKIQASMPDDAVVVCNFGDASLNHASAQAALNAAEWIAYTHHPLPIVFICEDNGIGVSVETPAGWVAKHAKSRSHCHYFSADGLDLLDTYQQTQAAFSLAREQRVPVFLHLKVVRLMGHAGSDIESHYWTQAQIEANESRDPLLYTAGLLQQYGVADKSSIIARYEAIRSQVVRLANEVATYPKLDNTQDIMASILPSSMKSSARQQPQSKTAATFVPKLQEKKRTMAQCLNLAFRESLSQQENLVFFGEDVAKKGGVYRVTADLQKEFGTARVFDTLLDETTILGTAIGFGLNGFIPVPEIQFLAFIHNAIDQIRGEAATLSFFSNGQFANQMIVRVPGLAYQKGFGGHFHNDNALAFLREIPGIVLLCPSHGRDAVLLWREAVRLAVEEKRVVIFLEPIALYHAKDCYEAGDQAWMCAYPDSLERVEPYQVATSTEQASDVVILSYGNGYYLSEKVLPKVQQIWGITPKLIDLRWLAPLPLESLSQALQGCEKLIIVDECRQTGSVSEQLITWLVEDFTPMPRVKRVVAEDCYIPLGQSWQHLLPSEESILAAVADLLDDTESLKGVRYG